MKNTTFVVVMCCVPLSTEARVAGTESPTNPPHRHPTGSDRSAAALLRVLRLGRATLLVEERDLPLRESLRCHVHLVLG